VLPDEDDVLADDDPEVVRVVELPESIDDAPPSGHWHGSYPSPLPAHT